MYWVTRLRSCHGNRHPYGKEFRLSPWGQRLIEWLSGCKTNGDVWKHYWQSHTSHWESVKSNKTSLCVCIYVIMCSWAEEQVIRAGVWVGGLQYKHFSGLGKIWINESSHFYSQIQGTQACIFNLMNSLQVNVCINNIKQHCEYIYVQLLWIYCPLQFACAVNTIKPCFVLMSKKAVLQTEKKKDCCRSCSFTPASCHLH